MDRMFQITGFGNRLSDFVTDNRSGFAFPTHDQKLRLIMSFHFLICHKTHTTMDPVDGQPLTTPTKFLRR